MVYDIWKLLVCCEVHSKKYLEVLCTLVLVMKISSEMLFYRHLVTYLLLCYYFRLSFKFLKPSLSEVSNIYTLPFSRSVWITYTVTVAILSVALYVTQKVGSLINPSQTGPPPLFGDAALNSLAVMCAEGKIIENAFYYS